MPDLDQIKQGEQGVRDRRAQRVKPLGRIWGVSPAILR